jgi:signal transduction histidine kinase
VFERFWQADPARSGPDHHGLGLAIAQAIACDHGGRLQALEASGGGCRMQLELPLAAAATAAAGSETPG